MAELQRFSDFNTSPKVLDGTKTNISALSGNGTVVTFDITYLFSEGNNADLPTIPLPFAATQTANRHVPLTAFKSYTIGGVTTMSDPFAYIDFTEATPIIKFSQFGTLPSGYTAELRISGSYEVA